MWSGDEWSGDEW